MPRPAPLDGNTPGGTQSDGLGEIDRWLLAAARGDAQAFSLVYQQLAGKLVAVAFRILQDRHEAEDVVQEVFVTLWRQRGDFAPHRGSGEAWLVTICRHRAIDRARARGRGPMPSADAADPPADALALTGPGSEVSDAAQSVEQAFSALEPRHARVIRLAWLDGLSHRELAEREGVPIGTIKTWIFRGLRAMRERLSR